MRTFWLLVLMAIIGLLLASTLNGVPNAVGVGWFAGCTVVAVQMWRRLRGSNPN